MRDVGKSGIMPGMKEPHHPAKKTVEAKLKVAGEPDQKAPEALEEQPTPLDVTCDSKMRVFPAKTRLPVVVGPPAPPAPTIVQFDRNVVVLRGRVNEQPGQLTCDNLKLTLVPCGRGPPPPTPAQDRRSPDKPAASEKSRPLWKFHPATRARHRTRGLALSSRSMGSSLSATSSSICASPPKSLI